MPRTAKTASSYKTREQLMKELAIMGRKLEKVQQVQPARPKMRQAVIEPETDEDGPELENHIGNFPPNVERVNPGRFRKNPVGRMFTADAPEPFSAVIHVTPHVLHLLSKRTRGSGGFQSFHEVLRKQVDPRNNELILHPRDFHRLVNYATNYGEGGFQSALRWLVSLWVQENLASLYHAE